MRALSLITLSLVALLSGPSRAQEAPAAPTEAAPPRIAAVAAPLPEADCGGLTALPLSDQPSDLLAGRFQLTLPLSAAHANVPNSVMAAPSPEVTSSLYFLAADADRMGIVANETFQLAGDDLEGVARRYLTDLPAEGAPWNLALLPLADPSMRAIAYWPSNLVIRGDADVWALGVLYVMPDGGVAHVSFRLDSATASHGLGCTGYAAKVAASAHAGGRSLEHAAHDETVTVAGGRRLRIPVPANAALLPQPGPDFDVYYVIPLVPLDEPSPSMGVYVGAYPQDLEPSNLPDVPGKLLGQKGAWMASDVPASTTAVRQLRLERRLEISADTDGKKKKKAKKGEETPPAPEAPPLYVHVFVAAPTEAQLEALKAVAEGMSWEKAE